MRSTKYPGKVELWKIDALILHVYWLKSTFYQIIVLVRALRTEWAYVKIPKDVCVVVVEECRARIAGECTAAVLLCFVPKIVVTLKCYSATTCNLLAAVLVRSCCPEEASLQSRRSKWIRRERSSTVVHGLFGIRNETASVRHRARACDTAAAGL